MISPREVISPVISPQGKFRTVSSVKLIGTAGWVAFLARCGRLSSPPRTHHRSTACTATPRRLPRCGIRLAGRALPQPRKCLARLAGGPTPLIAPSDGNPEQKVSEVHPRWRRPCILPRCDETLSLECAGVCCLDAVPRDLRARALPTRPSPALWLLRLSSLKHSVGRLPWGGLELGSVGLALAAAPHTSLSRRCAATAALGQAPPPTTPSLCCGTLLLSPSPAAPPRLLLLSCWRATCVPSLCATPLSPPRPRIPCGRARDCCLGLGGHSLRLRLHPPGCGTLPPRPARLSPLVRTASSLSLSARRSPPHARVRPCLRAAWALWETPSCLRSPLAALSSLPAPRDR